MIKFKLVYWLLIILLASSTITLGYLILERKIENSLKDEIILEQQQTQIETRRVIDEAIKNSPRDATVAREWLQQRQLDRINRE